MPERRRTKWGPTVGRNSVGPSELRAAVAGDGLAGGAGTALSVGVDGVTTEINSDAIRVKDGAITTAKLANGALSADATGRAKMADGFITAAKMTAGLVGGVFQAAFSEGNAGNYTRYWRPVITESSSGVTVEKEVQMAAHKALTITAIQFAVLSNGGAPTGTVTITLRKNGVDDGTFTSGALQVTVNRQSVEVTGSLAVAKGDLLSMKIVGASLNSSNYLWWNILWE